jgi:hypothetical protein
VKQDAKNPTTLSPSEAFSAGSKSKANIKIRLLNGEAVHLVTSANANAGAGDEKASKLAAEVMEIDDAKNHHELSPSPTFMPQPSSTLSPFGSEAIIVSLAQARPGPASFNLPVYVTSEQWEMLDAWRTAASTSR